VHRAPRYLCAFLLAGLLVACSSLPEPLAGEMVPPLAGEPDRYALRAPPPVHASPQRAAAPEEVPTVDRFVTGQILVSTDPDAISLFVALFAEAFQPWTHMAVVSVEAEGVFVYDTTAGFVTTGGRPSDAFTGAVRRIKLADYISGDTIFGLYSPRPDVDSQKFVDYVRGHFERKTPFDGYFNSADSSALYCSELMALGVVAAGGAPIPLAPVRLNRSYERIRGWLGIPSMGFYLPTQFTDPVRRVALWSRAWSHAQIEASFAAQEELARRLDVDSRLGHVLNWSNWAVSFVGALSLRASAQAFMEAALAAGAESTVAATDTARIRERVNALANAYFAER
jgi:hypothetical protein